ncbi:septation protein SepH [Nocardioides speluncae]|uniref:septation protein SepH n=1 Tax=Nocardioides speluncae TaxID=2670337 RepID=UPI000D69A48C|nr:septation protein SepH [Nocardioides speluncae]
MLHLTLAGLSEDNERLLLVSDKGERFTLVIDSRLRAALRGEHARIGQLEIQMESALRPRDIQARIRAGDTPEAVAQAAQTTVDRVMPYAGPVLAERAHIAERAQRSSVRRKSGDAGAARTLGDAVAALLRSENTDPETVEWDAWRREDGRWTLSAAYTSGKRKGVAKFTYDMPGNYVLTENDDARWLVGDGVAKAAAPEMKDELRQARQRRLAVVNEDELPLGDDAIELVTRTDDDEATEDLTETVAEVRRTPDIHEIVEQPVEAYLDDEPPAPRHDIAHAKAAPAAESAPADADAEDEPQTRRPVRKNRGRASVPSWDEIMFGGGKSD